MKIYYKDLLFVFIFVFLITITVTAASYLYTGNEVSYDNSKSGLTSIDVQGALDELYTKCNNSTTNLPNNHTCTQKTNIKCQRATTLHTETCTNSITSSYCQGDGYALNDTIAYGNSTTTTGVLTTGDAFDCDINGDGTFDSATERFYYVSDYFDTSTKTFNDKVAVLVYYSNTDDGVASTTNVAYNSSNQNYNGPTTAIGELPTTTQWSNISLYKNTRQILTYKNTTSTTGGTLPISFDYSGYVARLLTYQELYHGCYDYNLSIDSTKGLSTNCKFLFERTKYTNSSLSTDGSWAETPRDSTSNTAYNWYSSNRSTSSYDAYNTDSRGARPTIEILKSEISY